MAYYKNYNSNSNQGCKHIVRSALSTLFSLIQPHCFHQLSVTNALFRLTEQDLMVHLLKILVSSSAFPNKFVFLLSLPHCFIQSLRRNEFLVLNLLSFVHIPSSWESLSNFFKCSRHFSFLTNCISIRFFMILSNLSLKFCFKCFFNNFTSLSTGFVLRSF